MSARFAEVGGTEGAGVEEPDQRAEDRHVEAHARREAPGERLRLGDGEVLRGELADHHRRGGRDEERQGGGQATPVLAEQRFEGATDGGFGEYQVNNINTLIGIPDDMSDAEATLVVTAGTAMYGLTELGGLVAGESVVVTGPGPIGLLGVAVAKALGAHPVILTGTRDNRLKIGRELGADYVINAKAEDPVAAVRRLNGGRGVDYVVECSGAPDAVNEAARMVNRGGKICLAAFPHEPAQVDIAYLVRNNIYVFGIRGEGQSATHRAMALMKQKRFDARLIHTHTFPLDELPTALNYARERIEDAIKVVVKAGL